MATTETRIGRFQSTAKLVRGGSVEEGTDWARLTLTIGDEVTVLSPSETRDLLVFLDQQFLDD